MMKSFLSLMFHGSCAAFHLYAINWLSFIGLNIKDMAGFFTVWTTVFHLVMNVILAAHDVSVLLFSSTSGNQTSEHDSTNTKIIGILSSKELCLGLLLHLAVVMSSFTQFVFWALYLFDPEMILPGATNFPSFLNHMLHTLPLFFAIITLFIFSINFPNAKQERQCQTISTAGIRLVYFVGFVYLVFTLVIFELQGTWPYPFMFSFSRVDFLVFSFFVFLFSIVICYSWSFLEFKIKNIKIA